MPYQHDNITPYNQAQVSKKEQVSFMFDSIAEKYDSLNSILSWKLHKTWRKKAIAQLQKTKPQRLLDIATGTGDLALEAYAQLHPKEIIGIDISEKMLAIGRKKIQSLQLQQHITLQKGNSEDLPFPDNHFDSVMVAFGVRNFQHLEKGLSEMQRVLKPSGTLLIVEFSIPRNPFIKLGYRIYGNLFIPLIGKLFSQQYKAYNYLNKSVKAFPYGEKLARILAKIPFQNIHYYPMSFGICTLYVAKK